MALQAHSPEQELKSGFSLHETLKKEAPGLGVVPQGSQDQT